MTISNNKKRDLNVPLEKNWQQYYQLRFRYDPGRSRVWKAITEYLQKYIDSNKDTVLDLGTGYGDFINNIKAKKKIAIDMNTESKDYLNTGVSFYSTSSCDISNIQDNSVNVVFASNLFEHLGDDEMHQSINEILRVLAPKGKVIIIQPNYKYSFRDYFDDYTHKKAYSHVSLSALLQSYGFRNLVIIPRFLPFSMNSILPKSYLLTKIYLSLPMKPFAKQMLLILDKE